MISGRILVFGYGNPGRRDDGLGNSFVESLDDLLKEMTLPPGSSCEVDSNFQLNIEDAELISHFDSVVFVDATMDESVDAYRLSPLSPDDSVVFTTHAASPAYIFHLCREVFHREPNVYLFQIRGYDWEFLEGLSSGAAKNLEAALGFFKKEIHF